MEVAAGAMSPLLRKLGELLLDEYNLGKKVKKGVRSLATELTMMHSALRKVGDLQRDKLDDQVRIWAGKVRELSYEMEDAVDAFMVRVEEDEDGEPPTIKKKVRKFLKKSTRLFRKGLDLHQISGAIEEAQDLAKQLGELRQRYGLEMHNTIAPATGAAAIDPRLLAMYKDVTEFVGIDNTLDEVLKILIGDEEWRKNQLKTISIVGFGGLGKTTLAKAVYEKIKDRFDCGAFVSVSQSPDIRKVFKDMLYELDSSKYSEIHTTERGEKQLLDELGKFLNKKRYLVIIDDIWDEQAWRFIKCAFSRYSLGSVVITTTRKVNVSEACCSSSEDTIYKMKPLSDDDSLRLFYKRIFQGESECPHELKQVSIDILKKCGGIPLAIITIASLLTSNQRIKAKEQWYILRNCIGRGLVEGDSLEEMQRILSLSYYDLPSHLKTCLLYMSIFPEDYEIKKDRLIWRWIAEGFIQTEKQGTSMFELGEAYFNELVNRSMLQPVGVDVEGRAKACRVHDMLLDLIRSLASEENFVTILDPSENSTPNSRNKIRRLSLHNMMKKNTTKLSWLSTKSLSQVRSVALFGPDDISVMPSLARFGVLCVLDLERVWTPYTWCTTNLKYIGNLLHLRYLCISSSSIGDQIPMEIGKLRYLQSLHLRGFSQSMLPSSVFLLRHLLCLRISKCMYMPAGFGKLISLEELYYVLVHGTDQSGAKQLGCLTEIRVLKIRCGDIVDESLDKVVTESLTNLRKLQSLSIRRWFSHMDKELMLLDRWVPPPQLCRFTSSVVLSTVPTWIKSPAPPLLTTLHINVGELQQGDIQAIGMLPALLDLLLKARRGLGVKSPPEDSFLVTPNAFPCLKECRLYGLEILPSMFPPGAMPMVQVLRFAIRPSPAMANEELDLGMGNLPSLGRVEVDLLCKRRSSLEVVAEAEAGLRLAAEAHPNQPTLLTKRYVDQDGFLFKERYDSSDSLYPSDSDTKEELSSEEDGVDHDSQFQPLSEEEEEEDGVDLE